ncbi:MULTISPECIES: alpha/beta hydrolase [Planktothricoides]|uniref:Alpha/beta hydrolase n=2 Tax=Planktothricoides raciborskii TaxID=132608 RepID=A0AAU8JEC1_9CYAN|nr:MULTISPECIES: alpha/beta hydrolase [Planktothricoides]KOR33829.1 serine esterase [Planktothricoides sp. SR001]MBD2547801.1 alpha/beta hydrolase [Planktothricoides raciborskii FACHB-1370]MBD2586230.1 alpha/beta hydrolase [Planktothricoides raciborskii FACHB-1261]
MSLQANIIPPANGQDPQGAIVLLHGWGANLHDLAPLGLALNLPEYQFIFPDAPFPHHTVPGGQMWYDLESENYFGLAESRQMLIDWLKSLESQTGVPLSRTILSGFSQGGAMILDVGVRIPVAGLVSMSGYLHAAPEPVGDRLPPMLIMHGSNDPVVPLQAARQAREMYLMLGASVKYHEFEMSHEICPQEITLMRNFIHQVISPKPTVEQSVDKS